MIDSLKSGRSIQEFWVDFLLEEEFGSNPSFAIAFATACGLSASSINVVKVVHSLVDDFGEADLAVILKTGSDDSRIALLIENKITAAFQPEQAERYGRRGERGVQLAHWSAYRTVLVAPSAYIRDGHGFDCALSLETVGNWVCLTDPMRRAYKRDRLDQAIKKKNTTGVQVVDPTMTKFRAWYGEVLGEIGFVPPAPRPAYWDDNWMEWTSSRLPKDWKFRHKTRFGVLDVSHPAFSEADFERLASRLPTRAAYGLVGKHRGAVTLTVPRVADYSDPAALELVVQSTLLIAREIEGALYDDFAGQ